ncbi:5-methyltetrahydropteroyltriglutamate--homocysteine S-methyltransferase [Candidatus Vidania fulgoroideorum]
MITHILGYPSIGNNRDLKITVESFLNNHIEIQRLDREIMLVRNIRKIKKGICETQDSKLDICTIGSFPYYDKVLTLLMYLGIFAKRHIAKRFSFVKYFHIAKGYGDSDPLKMSKWFGTNYHFMVPEWDNLSKFYINKLLDEDLYTRKYIYGRSKFTIVGPVTLLMISRYRNINIFLNVFKRYINILKKISGVVNYIQIDEPILSADLNGFQKRMFERFYRTIGMISHLRIVMAIYFTTVSCQIYNLVKDIRLYGIHIDARTSKKYVGMLSNNFAIISLGVIDGESVWIGNYKVIHTKIRRIASEMRKSIGIWLSSSCSLEHIPISVSSEKIVIKWIAFAYEKICELNEIKHICLFGKKDGIYLKNKIEIINMKNFNILKDDTDDRCARSLKKRNTIYKKWYDNNYHTTTIGSFPQTHQIRKLRLLRKMGRICENTYSNSIEKIVEKCVRFQESIGLDLITNGEMERNDMVEYFCEHISGILVTRNGWVHSYGHRCVKPSIIYSNLSRRKNITIAWAKHLKSITDKPIKFIITGPITILKWSFYRKDIGKKYICNQIANILREEVEDLKKEKIKDIQIDEPALKECRPLRGDRKIRSFFIWAVRMFNYVCDGLHNICVHTHICYSTLENIDVEYISKLHADVLTIEGGNYMDVVRLLKNNKIDMGIGIGLYNSHSLNCPSVRVMLSKLMYIRRRIGNVIWLNPDCGLKTRRWKDIIMPLRNMVKASRLARYTLR